MLSFDKLCRPKLEFQMIYPFYQLCTISSSFGKWSESQILRNLFISWRRRHPVNKQSRSTHILLGKIPFDAWQIKSIWKERCKIREYIELPHCRAKNWSIECPHCDDAFNIITNYYIFIIYVVVLIMSAAMAAIAVVWFHDLLSDCLNM